MLNAARVHGRPTMVIAIRTAAITQPSAIHRPPKTIHNMFSKSDTGDMYSLRSLRMLQAPGDLRYFRAGRKYQI